MNYDKKDYDFVQGVLKGKGIKSSDRQTIYDLYKKYIQPDMVSTCSGCGEISVLFRKLKEWMFNNQNKFI
jgi:hypothetical protein